MTGAPRSHGSHGGSDSLSAYTTMLNHQQSELTKLRPILLAANDELTQLKQSNPGRDPHVQDLELKVQSLVVQQISLESSVEHSQAEIAQIKSQLATASR
jgi:chromosome segregation ATPase